MQRKFLFWKNSRIAIITLTLVLLLLGACNVLSAGAFLGNDLLFKYIMFSLGFSVIITIALLFKKIYEFCMSKIFIIAMMTTVVVMLIAVMFWGTTVNGATRWLGIGSFMLQPSELAKLAVIITFSSVLGNLINKNKEISFFKYDGMLIWLMGLVMGLFYLVYKEPDMGTATIIIGLWALLIACSGIRIAEIIGLGAIGTISIIYLALNAGYREARFAAWGDPYKYATEGGYQILQSWRTIADGGIFGQGWGRGISKYAFLPEVHTDFAFANFCQESGFIGALFLIIVFIMLGAAILNIAAQTKDARGFLLVVGIFALIIGQAGANMLMVLGIIPVIGVPMPFISYGGTSLMVNLAAIGLIIAVYNNEVRNAMKEESYAKMTPQERRADLRVINSSKTQTRRRF